MAAKMKVGLLGLKRRACVVLQQQFLILLPPLGLVLIITPSILFSCIPAFVPFILPFVLSSLAVLDVVIVLVSLASTVRLGQLA